MALGWASVWKIVVEIVKPVLGEILRKIALAIWDVVEHWAESLAGGHAKPTSEEKAIKFKSILSLVEPDLSEEQADIVVETAHAERSRKSGKTATARV